MSVIVECRRVDSDWEGEGERREVRLVLRLVRCVVWVFVGSSLSVGGEDGEELEELGREGEGEGERMRRGDVCVATSLWKSSVGSESTVSMSEAVSSLWLSLLWVRGFISVL